MIRHGRRIALALLAAGAAAAAHGHRDGATLWRDDFTGGRVRADQWSRCAQPWEGQAVQCAATQAGHGEQVYWSPALFGAGLDPVVPGPRGGISILARRLTPAQKQAVAAVAAQQHAGGGANNALLKAGWSSGWLQSRRSFGIGTTLTTRIRTAAGDASWGGVWMLNDPAHRSWPPEIDVAEVTNTPDGGMYVRQAIHYKDVDGTQKVANCPTNLPRRDWLDVSVTRLRDSIVFGLNGKTCSLPAPPGFDQPMQIIFSQQVGGLAKLSTDATQPMALDIAWVAVAKARG